MPFQSEHSARVVNADNFQNDPFGTGSKFARINITNGVDAIIGKLVGEDKTTIQSYRFDASKFTVDQAKEWLSSRGLIYILFEEATMVNASEGIQIIETPDPALQDLSKSSENRLKSKVNNPYAIKSSVKDMQIKDIDLEKNIVIGYGNFWNYFDDDEDVLFTGVADKSIIERGVNASTPRKIAFCYQHNIKDPIGRYQSIKDDGIGLYFESKISASEQSKLIKIQEGILNQFSIGFNYIWDKIKWIGLEDPSFKFYSDKIINLEKALANGGFYGVFEINLWEISLVTQGANELSQVIGMKGKSKFDQISHVSEMIKKMTNVVRNGNYKDNIMFQFEIELKQLGSLVNSLVLNQEPDKSTLKTIKPKDIDYDYLINNI